MAKRDNGLNLQSGSLITRFLIGSFVAFMGVFLLGPLIWLALQAFTTSWTFPNWKPDGWTLIWWRRVFETPSMVEAIRNSFITAPIVVLVSLAGARIIPYGISSFAICAIQALTPQSSGALIVNCSMPMLMSTPPLL